MSETTFSTDPVAENPTTFVDYFGFQASERFYLPDGVQYIEFEIMNEGKKAQFQKLTQRDMVLERGSGNARVRVDPGQERHALIQSSVTGWNMYRGGKPQIFGQAALRDFLTLADPKIVEGLEKAIRKANPWLLAEMTVADIDKEIANLQEMRDVAAEREAGEGSSTSK